MVFSGAAFGVVAGSALALVGSIAGEWLGFELVRRHGRGLASRLVGDDEIDNLTGFFARHGTTAVIMTRPLPVVMETISIIAGLSGMSRLRFLAASLAGTAPIVVVYAYAGAVSRAGRQRGAGSGDAGHRDGRRLALVSRQAYSAPRVAAGAWQVPGQPCTHAKAYSADGSRSLMGPLLPLRTIG